MTTTIFDLPNETLYHICEYILSKGYSNDIRNLIKFKSICTKFYTIGEMHPLCHEIRKVLPLAPIDNYNHCEYLRVLMRVGSVINNRKVKNILKQAMANTLNNLNMNVVEHRHYSICNIIGIDGKSTCNLSMHSLVYSIHITNEREHYKCSSKNINKRLHIFKNIVHDEYINKIPYELNKLQKIFMQYKLI
jgi:hypothetical protein